MIAPASNPQRERYVHHVTLNSGHVRSSPRSEVGDGAVQMLTPLLARALSGERVPVPGLNGYTFSGGVEGRCCVVTVWGPQREPILTTGVATHSRCGSATWASLHAQAVGVKLATAGQDAPQAPWCANRVEVGAALYPDAMEWTGDWSRCIAWTWIEMRTGREET